MFHLNVRYRSRDGGGSCEAARQYIAREGRYAGRGDSVRWVRSLNMPEWVDGASAPKYWRAAEGRHSRVNARTAILVEFAVPKQLTAEEQDSLVLTMLEELSATGVEEPSFLRLPLIAALHEGYGRNPHVHVLVSLSLNDGICRAEDQWFRRYSPEHPTKGGARRSEYVTKRRWLYRVRELWATLANAALSRCGMQPGLDHRSHAARGLARAPQIHLGPRIAEMSRRGLDTERGRRRRAIEEANEAARELEARLLRRRQTLARAELEWQDSIHSEAYWRERQQTEWSELLRNHPLTAAAPEVRAHATALVVESDLANAAAMRQAPGRCADATKFAEAVGSGWEVISTPEGVWVIKPGQDAVVLLGPGYLATDSDAEDSLHVMLKLAQMLHMKAPVMAVAERVRASLQGILHTALDHGWRIIDMKPRRQRTKGPKL